MSHENTPATILLPEPTEARFSMRALLGATAIVALVAAGFGPIVRRLQPDEQARFLMSWAVWLLAAVAWIGYQARCRFKAEQLAGRTLLRLPMIDERVPHATPVRRNLNIAGAVFLSLIMSCAMSFNALSPPTSDELWVIVWT